MPGLTAKVFRTYNASWTMANLLRDMHAEGNILEKVKASGMAAAARQRSVAARRHRPDALRDRASYRSATTGKRLPTEHHLAGAAATVRGHDHHADGSGDRVASARHA